MLLYSSINNQNCKAKTEEELFELLNEKEYEYEYTYGFGWKCPTIHNKPITKKRAFEIIKEESFVDVSLRDDGKIHVNAFSANDMW